MRTLGRTAGAEFDQLLVSARDAVQVADRIRGVLAAAAGVSEREVTFRSGDGTVLAGTLTVPAGRDRSGRGDPHRFREMNRDGDHAKLPIGVSRALAEALARNGTASLRYDNVGFPKSGGDYLSTGLSDNLADAAAAVEWLRTAGGFVRDAVAVTGTARRLPGRGAGRRPRGRSRRRRADRVSRVTGREVLLWQSAKAADSLSAPVRSVLRLLRLDVKAQQRKALDKIAVRPATPRGWDCAASTPAGSGSSSTSIRNRWLREIRSPVLAITGAKDLQVDPDDLSVIADLVPAEVDTVRVPDLTHLVRRDAGPPSLRAYRRLVREPVDPKVLSLVADWTAGHLPRR